MKVPHCVAEHSVREHKENLLEYLREKCQNPTIKIEIQIDEQLIKAQQNTMPPKNEERYKLMQQKNPHLLLLEQKFNTSLVR